MYCHLIGCKNLTDLVFCDVHLRSLKLGSDFEIMENVSVRATRFQCPNKSMSAILQTADLLMNIFPLDIKPPSVNKHYAKKLRKKIANAMQHNKDNMLVIEISRNKLDDAGFFCNPWSNKDDHCTVNYLKIVPLQANHQLFVCKDSREIVCFIPSIDHQNEVFDLDMQQRMMVHLKWASNNQDSNVNFKAKKRKVDCSSWTFFGGL